jgi:diguanylate cyclase (GGDEF)-like protein
LDAKSKIEGICFSRPVDRTSEFAGRLKNQLKNGDFISRLSGDEFAVWNHTDDINVLNNIADRIKKISDVAFDVYGEKIEISVSIGGAKHPDDGQDILTLMKKADIAMYEAKRKGKKRFVLYNKTMEKKCSTK